MKYKYIYVLIIILKLGLYSIASHADGFKTDSLKLKTPTAEEDAKYVDDIYYEEVVEDETDVQFRRELNKSILDIYNNTQWSYEEKSKKYLNLFIKAASENTLSVKSLIFLLKYVPHGVSWGIKNATNESIGLRQLTKTNWKTAFMYSDENIILESLAHTTKLTHSKSEVARARDLIDNILKDSLGFSTRIEKYRLEVKEFEDQVLSGILKDTDQ